MNGSSEREAISRRYADNETDLDAKMTRCKDAESVTENTKSILAPMAGEEAIVHERLVSVTSAGAGELAANSGDEHESIVGWTFQPNNEKSIQSYPSPEFLNSLSFIKKFYPTPRWGEGKFTKVTHDNSCNSRHSERQRKNPAYYCNTSKLKGINMKNFFETDQAFMPLGIFASKSLAAWLPSRLAAKRVAFTLAEVLITLGIIGVVAAVTLPTLVANYQKTVWVNQLKKTYTTLNEGFKQMAASEGCTTLRCADISEDSPITKFDFTKAKTKEKFVKTFKLENVYVGGVPNKSIYNYKVKYLSGEESTFSDIDAESILFGTTSSGEIISFCYALEGSIMDVDINGLKSPNTLGRDIFGFSVFDFNDTVMVAPYGSKKWYEGLVAGGIIDENDISEEERIQYINDNCMTTDADGSTCSEKIIMDGWKMNY